MVPVRTCIGCRRRTEQDSVVRFALDPDRSDEVRPDPERRMPGRGAWLHPTQECFQAAVKRKAFSRAFRRSISTAHPLSLHDESGLERDEHPMSTDG